MEKLNEMLEAAIEGRFSERAFDESLLSAVEAKLAGYLSASEVSAQNLAQERRKIEGLIADISHQTKTPIANILLYAQLLEERELSEEARVCAQALRAQAEKLSFLIGSLVKTSRLETGVMALHPRKCALAPLLEAVLAQAGAKAREKGIALTAEQTSACALFDPKWTEEALYNIVDNALKYTPSGGRVTIRTRTYELFCRVDIADTGIGITEEEQGRIFGRFYRARAAGDAEGVGLGLYLTRQIVSGQGGYIKVKSAPGQGALFSVFLPLEEQ